MKVFLGPRRAEHAQRITERVRALERERAAAIERRDVVASVGSLEDERHQISKLQAWPLWKSAPTSRIPSWNWLPTLVRFSGDAPRARPGCSLRT